ncbi:MAG: rhomboid family intramembrane serine protease [Candidatus Pacearchaeota archaeon]|jgi:membrane associated rhomboid family serine protease
MNNIYEISPKKRRINLNFSLNIWLIIINVLVFIVFSILISKEILPLDYIALNPSNIFLGKYLWTFLSSMFMHAGFLHLFVNMLSLIFIGSLVEKLIGKRRYFWFYIISGIFAGLFFLASSLVFTKDIATYAVGASGALFGLIGLLIFLTPNLPVYVMFIPIPIKMKYAAPGMLILLWIVSAVGNIGIGNFAHLGGLICGMAYGLFLRKKFPKRVKYIQRSFS